MNIRGDNVALILKSTTRTHPKQNTWRLLLTRCFSLSIDNGWDNTCRKNLSKRFSLIIFFFCVCLWILCDHFLCAVCRLLCLSFHEKMLSLLYISNVIIFPLILVWFLLTPIEYKSVDCKMMKKRVGFSIVRRARVRRVLKTTLK